MASERRVTSSRLGRLTQLGRLAGGIAGGMLGEGARQVAQGRRPSMGDMLLTSGNAKRLADRLSEMRGAAMKVGQLLSMDSGEVLPPQLSEVLARLREDAHYMPLGQVARVLGGAWGKGWEKQFERFSFTPTAAASIGQVHDALLHDGRRIAVKVQYPGIRESIDSDVDNVATLLRVFRLVPERMDVGPLLTEAKLQLHREADYDSEAQAMQQFGDRLGDDPRFQVPGLITELGNRDVLAMTFLDGRPIETAVQYAATRRNAIAGAMTELALREVLEWGLVQTDPNFANYLIKPDEDVIQLLDFGATRSYSSVQRGALRGLLGACIDGNDGDVADAAIGVGYLDENEDAGYRRAVVELLRTATEPARQVTDFNFGASDIAQRMSEIVVQMRVRDQYGRLPPAAVLFLHRKLGGLYLLLSRLRATLPVRNLVLPYASVGERQHRVPVQASA
jgi:predicted unusual protein kinase regulating ubiquinone biosynthesis (AarF/ABC1/UbiB family)